MFSHSKTKDPLDKREEREREREKSDLSWSNKNSKNDDRRLNHAYLDTFSWINDRSIMR